MLIQNGEVLARRLAKRVEQLRPGHETICYLGLKLGRFFLGFAWLGAPAVCPACGKELAKIVDERGDAKSLLCTQCKLHIDPAEMGRPLPFEEAKP